MDTQDVKEKQLHLTVENIGGIDHTEQTITPGVTVLEGRNATNRTSFLQAIMAAMGSDRFSLKADSDEGCITAEMGDAVIQRTFERSNGSVETAGEGLLDDPSVAELYAFLLEDNEARQTIMRREDLREVMIRPVDTQKINTEIDRLTNEKQRLTSEIEEIDERKEELPDLQQREETLLNEIKTKREELSEKEAKIQANDQPLVGANDETTTLESKLDALNQARTELEEIRFDTETLQEALESLRSERQEKEDQLSNFEVDGTADEEELREAVADLRTRKRRLDTQVGQLQSVIEFNEEMLDGADDEIEALLRGEHEQNSEGVTDRLMPGEENVVCWTCGSEINSGDVTDTLDRLREARSEKITERETIQESIQEKQLQISSIEEKQSEREQLESRLEKIDRDITRRQEQYNELGERQDWLQEAVRRLEANVESMESDGYDQTLGLHRKANEIEFAIEQKENELDDVRAEIDEIGSRLDERSKYAEQREAVQEELIELRTKIDRIEETAVEAFNTHMEEVLDILDYDNLARVWVERVEEEVKKGRRKVTETVFELHIVRQTETGSAYEDTITHLSESEREVMGLVFALAGYLVHDLHEDVPVMLLDSLEAIDSERIAQLVEYFNPYADFLVVALLPEYAAALDSSATRITEI